MNFKYLLTTNVCLEPREDLIASKEATNEEVFEDEVDGAVETIALVRRRRLMTTSTDHTATVTR